MSDQWNFDPDFVQIEMELNPQPGRLGLGLGYPHFNPYERYGAPRKIGTMVYSVEANGAGARAGFLEGDMILELNGVAVTLLPGADKDLLWPTLVYLRKRPNGSTVQVKVLRDELEQTLELQL